MRITFTEQGGVGYFPGLRQPVTIDGAALAPADAAELARLVAALPADVLPSAAVADGRRYTIVIDDGTTERHIEAADPLSDPALGRLITFLRKQARAVRRSARSRDRTQLNGDDARTDGA